MNGSPGDRLILRPPGRTSPRERKAVAGLLAKVSDDFVPPLARRVSPLTTNRVPAGGRTVDPYVEQVLAGWNLLAFDDAGLTGLLSFVKHMSDFPIPALAPLTYVSTVAIDPSFRRRGTARLLYGALLQGPFVDAISQSKVATRTWSTNVAHLALLQELRFERVSHLPNDRGPGVDTVYFARLRETRRPGRR